MIFWIIWASLLALIWLLDGLRLRGRAKRFHRLPSDGIEPKADMHFILRDGAQLDEATRRAAAAYLEAQHLDVLLLLPSRLPAAEALLATQNLQPDTFRKDRIAPAKAAGEAILVRSSVLERFGHDFTPPTTSAAFAQLAHELKKYACTAMDVAVAPGLQPSVRHWRERGALMDFIYGGVVLPILFLQTLLLIAGAIWIPYAGFAALLAYHVQPLLVLGGTRLQPQGLLRYAVCRMIYDVGTMLGMFNLHKKQRKQAVEERRPQYRELLAQGTERFFEEPRQDCPICGSTQLQAFVASRDMIQFKPGIFKIARCGSCAHLFQNPRLSIEGLNFYYKDFYDGLGGAEIDRVFSHNSAPYRARAGMLKDTPKPRRWLDVGAGHGHFCCVARDSYPGVPFDGLDLSQSVLDAHKRGWVDRAYKGLFPDLADQLAREGAYDVISMSHYLEHTRDPESEIAAAAKVLPEGGHLLIELPDPDCRFGQWFGAYWMPWFQPQHQHMLSSRNLDRLLKKHSFEALTWHHGEAHQQLDFMFSLVLFLNRVAPPTDMPWQKPSTIWQKLWHKGVFLLCSPIILIARIMDKTMAPLFRRPGWSNTYRVLARRAA